MKPEKVYIVIVNWNGWKDTVECLASVYQSDYPDYAILVCDNASQDDSLLYLQQWKAVHDQENRLVILHNKRNLGYAGGNNIGIRYALAQSDAGFIWLLNNDTVVDPKALSELVSYAWTHSGTGLMGSQLRYYEEPHAVQCVGCWLNPVFGVAGNYHENAGKQLDYVSGASLFVSTAFVRQVGMLSEEYFLYFEEADWAVRAKRQGYSCACVMRSIVYHKEGVSIGASNKDKAQKSLLGDFYGIRSRILFTLKFYKKYLFFVYLGLLLTMANRIRRKQWKRVGMVFSLMLHPRQSFIEFKKRNRICDD